MDNVLALPFTSVFVMKGLKGLIALQRSASRSACKTKFAIFPSDRLNALVFRDTGLTRGKDVPINYVLITVLTRECV